MPKIVECVPNFSEGQTKEIIEAIAKAIASSPGCTLLDVDPGASTNRTVYTFVGSPADVVKGAIAGALAASQCIDMTQHAGEHPRLGALDVCPFIPVQDVSMEECVECANQFAAVLAATLNVPVYLYGHASSKDSRKAVPQIRSGQYEGLEEKLKLPEWAPDYGPAEFVPTWGATIAGARNFLIAYNVNLLGTKEQAHRIALNIREQGRGSDQPGRLKNVQAIGWYLQEANLAQVSINIGNIETTPVHVAYEECVKDAKELKLSVVGSEVVGLIPKSCLLEAADFYIEREDLLILEEEHKIRLAIDRLGLHSFKHFDPKEKIIEYMLESDDSDSPLTSLTVKDFIRSVGSRTAVPGGGSVAAVVGAMGAGLGAMASLLTYGNKKFESLDDKMRKLIPPLHKVCHRLIPMADADSLAFNQFMMAAKLPQKTPEEQERKDAARKDALYNAIAVPFSVAKEINTLWSTLKEVAPVVNIQCLSDVQVCVRCLQTAVWGAYYNVMTNAASVEELEYKEQVISDIQGELKIMEAESKLILELLEARN